MPATLQAYRHTTVSWP